MSQDCARHFIYAILWSSEHAYKYYLKFSDDDIETQRVKEFAQSVATSGGVDIQIPV